MNDALFILVMLVSGFIFTSRYPLSRFKQLRSSGWALYFHTFTWGILFGGVAFVIFAFLRQQGRLEWIALFLKTNAFLEINPYLLIWYTITLLLAFCAGKCLSWCSQVKKISLKQCVLENPLKTKIYEATSQSRMLLVTLDTGKVYAGIVFASNDSFEKPNTDFIVLGPLKSGYRDPKTLVIKFTNNYWKYYNGHLRDGSFAELVSSFSVVIPVANIVSVGNYQPTAFKTINNNTQSIK